METNKKNKKNKTWDLRAVPQPRSLDPARYRARSRALHRTASVAELLLAKRLKGKDRPLVAALARLEDAQGLARAANHVVAAVATTRIAEARQVMLTAVSGVTTVLVTLGRSPAVELAAEATAVLEEVFGGSRAELYRMVASNAWYAVGLVRERLEVQPGLRKRLLALVQPQAVDVMLESHAELDALVIDPERGGRLGGVDVVGVVTHVNAVIDHYVTCVLATATPDDLDALEAADTALQPLVELREELARQRSGKVAEEEEVEPVSAAPPPATPAPGPAPVTEEAPSTG